MGFFSKNRNKEADRTGSTPSLSDAQKLLEEFEKYTTWRSSNAYKDMKNTLEKLATETNLEKREQLNEKFGECCRNYLSSKQETSGHNMKEKLNLVERALGYQQFTACEIAHDQIKSMDQEKVSLDSAMKITKYSKKFRDAYERFQARSDKKVINIDKRNEMLKMYEEHLEINFDGARSPRRLEEAIRENKSWGEISFPTPIVKVMDNAERVGRQASSRSVVTVNGQKGVFTEYSEISKKKMLENVISAVPPGTIQAALGNHFEDMLELCDTLKEITSSSGNNSMLNSAKGSLYDFMRKKLTEGDLDSNREKYKDLIDAIEMPEFDETLLFMTGQARAMFTTQSNMEFAKIKVEKGALNKRNELTTRMAEALGIEHLVAHSERIQMVRNGKVIEGDFMEFVEGVDLSKGDPETNKEFQKATLDDPEFQRSANQLEVFDFLCGQEDRHSENIIYTLGEPGPDGKRRLTSIKGIDNDSSFSNRNTLSDIYIRNITNIPAVDAELAERIKKLDREKLEFYLGDVLDQNCIDRTMERLDAMKTHFMNTEKCTLIKKDEWEKDIDAVKVLQNSKDGIISSIRNKVEGRNALGIVEDPEKKAAKLAAQRERQKENERKAEMYRERKAEEYRKLAKRQEPEKTAGTRIQMNVKEFEKEVFEEIKKNKHIVHQKRTPIPSKTKEAQTQAPQTRQTRAMGK